MPCVESSVDTVYLDELHEEMNILGVELLGEVGDRLVYVLRQRVPLLSPDEEPLLPDLLDVLPRLRHCRRRERRGRAHCSAKLKRLR